MKEALMAARGETLARQFESKVQEATAVFEQLSDADWKKLTAAEKWPVGVVAHHIATSHEGIGGILKALADGKPGPNIPKEALDAMNATHAREHAGCTKAETIALHKKNAAAAAGMLRGLDVRVAKVFPLRSTVRAICGLAADADLKVRTSFSSTPQRCAMVRLLHLLHSSSARRMLTACRLSSLLRRNVAFAPTALRTASRRVPWRISALSEPSPAFLPAPYR